MASSLPLRYVRLPPSWVYITEALWIHPCLIMPLAQQHPSCLLELRIPLAQFIQLPELQGSAEDDVTQVVCSFLKMYDGNGIESACAECQCLSHSRVSFLCKTCVFVDLPTWSLGHLSELGGQETLREENINTLWIVYSFKNIFFMWKLSKNSDISTQNAKILRFASILFMFPHVKVSHHVTKSGSWTLAVHKVLSHFFPR